MGIVNNVLAGASGNQGYFLSRSLRFRNSASAYLNRTFGSNGNQQQWTWSGWIKAGRFGSQQPIFNAYSNATNYGLFTFSANAFISASDTLKFYTTVSNTTQSALETSAVYRDPSSWYHVVLQIDTTQATSSNRVRIYVNGVQQALTGTQPSQNANIVFYNTTSVPHQIGSLATGTYGYFDGYMAEINFIDGQSLTPSSFGMNDPATGVWEPKKYTGTYGTNGFYLPFTDNSAATATTIGRDFSGNGNNWTPNNISVTAGATYDSMTDVPTLTSPTTANYCVMNPLAKDSDVTMSNGNLQFDCTSGGLGGAIGTFAVSSGKWYWEVVSTAGAGSSVGIAKLPLSAYDANQTGTYLYLQGGDKRLSPSTDSAYGASWTTNDVIGIALDMDAGTVTFYKNNASQGTAFSSLSGDFTAWVQDGSGGSASTIIANFGQRPFAYTPPTGFKALNTFNLPTPTIGATPSTQANKYMDVSLYSGNGTSTGNTQVITNTGGFQPDFVWIKARNSSTPFHILNDSVRGTNKILYSNSTDVENSVSNVFNSFNSNGFTVDYNSSFSQTVTNQNGQTYVGWQWRASNATGVTNTAGSITSTVSANTTAGFSVVTGTSNGANPFTVGHGLGVTPNMIIFKLRSGVDGWYVAHSGLANMSSNWLVLNSTAAVASGTAIWGNGPTSTVFGVRGSSIAAAGQTFVAYCFAEVAGYSKFGTWQNNNSTDGTFVYLGFRPRFIMLKNTDNVERWFIQDSARQPYNYGPATSNYLVPNSTASEGTNGADTACIDFLSNGFKIRTTNPASGEISFGTRTYIYACFAESPFKYALAR